jgi:Zn-dependent protease with chaperone function
MAGTVADARPPGTWRRALVALALWLGFYVLGIGLAVALVSLPYAQGRFEGTIGLSGLASALGGISVLWALFPRFQPFQPPSEALDRGKFPRFGELVDDIARRVGHAQPQDLFLTPEANAFAGSRKSGWLSRRRSMVGVGLVLFEICDRDELSSVVAHEMGHHFAGDVALGPWVHRIRRAIAGALERMEGSNFWLHLPFVGYGELFLRITRRTSREQELAADALAARTCGAPATAAALARLHKLAPLWEAYWDGEVVPLLNLGFRPPLLDGFRRMMKLPSVREDLEKIARSADERPPSPADTHPPLTERLLALGARDEFQREAPEEGARTWFDDPAAAELVVIRSVLKDPATPLAPVAWEEAGEKVWIPQWKKIISELGDVFDDLTLPRLPVVTADPSLISDRLPGTLAVLSPQALRQRMFRLLAAWLAVQLHGRGFTVSAQPGAEVILTRDGVSIETGATVRALADGTLAPAAWRDRCAALGF